MTKGFCMLCGKSFGFWSSRTCENCDKVFCKTCIAELYIDEDSDGEFTIEVYCTVCAFTALQKKKRDVEGKTICQNCGSKISLRPCAYCPHCGFRLNRSTEKIEGGNYGKARKSNRR